MIAALLAEFLGSLFFVLMAIGIKANEQDNETTLTSSFADLRKSTSYTMSISLSIGITYTIISAAFSRFSGAHFNPAITVAAIVGKRIPLALGLCYILVQMVGAVCGSAMFDGLSGGNELGELGVAKVATKYDTGRIFGIELVATALITFVWLSLNNTFRTIPHVSFRSETGPLYIGFAYFIGSMITLRWDGAGLNPIRAFGPSLVANEWRHWWVYWLGPLMGGLTGILLFELLAFLAPRRQDSAKIQPSR